MTKKDKKKTKLQLDKKKQKTKQLKKYYFSDNFDMQGNAMLLSLNILTKTDFAFIFLLKGPLNMLVMISYVVMNFVIISFTQHLAGKLICGMSPS